MNNAHGPLLPSEWKIFLIFVVFSVIFRHSNVLILALECSSFRVDLHSGPLEHQFPAFGRLVPGQLGLWSQSRTSGIFTLMISASFVLESFDYAEISFGLTWCDMSYIGHGMQPINRRLRNPVELPMCSVGTGLPGGCMFVHLGSKQGDFRTRLYAS